MCVLSIMCAGKDECKNHGKTSKNGQNRHENRKSREKPEAESSIIKFKANKFEKRSSIKVRAKFQVKDHGCQEKYPRGAKIAKFPKYFQDLTSLKE